ncbi:ATP-sensitive inward rectifier potassium channel 10 [Scytonema hofmannii PCC 7110]|uniref:ATP-sensitive inward rectifier potassium channel 10 n=1 Tax=Scytonema hofmannii PCC 7110 TaxID=128403 RepID=A0A139X486_9CYAN|nr:ion channel [Scytonema hofmannii]KYC39519.1 ATP-sensitive inward rectifier potassium channel 10 [Scytonema hofmannii PCC 7110]
MKTARRKAPVSRRMVNRHGSFNVVRKGISHKHWHDPYHLLLTLPWYYTLLVISLGYIIANALFALAYIIGGDGIENARPGNFFDAFFFSVQTMASIGYGAMYPKTPYANFLVTIESLLGLIGLAMGSGLMFARFSLPRARVMFSNIAVITPYNDVPTLMFRVANERENWILEAQVRVTLARTEITKEGDVMRRFYDMPLVRSQSPLFALTWTVMHVIDENSPLYGVTSEEMVEDEMEVVVTFTGLDETVSQTIHARHSYISEEIVWNMRFVDILGKTKDGSRCINYARFHDVVSLDEEKNGLGGC